MKISAAYSRVPTASQAQVRLIRMRFRNQAESLHALAKYRETPFGYENVDALRKEMRERAADHFQLRGEKVLTAGAVDGLLRWIERCRLDENGKLVVDDKERGF
jgi:hypothetical protein